VGSIVHADPSGEAPAVLTLLGGSLEVASARSGAAPDLRTVPAGELFLAPMECSLRPGELAVSAYFPRPPARSGTAWRELSRRHGDYALCGAGVLVTLDGSGRVEAARAALISVGPVPVLVDLTEAVAGRPHDAVDWGAAAALVRARVDPEDDIHATAAYRRHLAGVLTARAGAEAAATAAGRREAA
jgi:carbon-monoxide dehydrogenase medium subunit